MSVFMVVGKTDKETEVHRFSVALKSSEGHSLKLSVSEMEFREYEVGDVVEVGWSRLRRKPLEVPG
jgi:hypothetical protein